MKIIDFFCGELVKLGPSLFGDVFFEHKHPSGEYHTLVKEWELENKIVMYVSSRFIPKLNEVSHTILYLGHFYFITDNSYAIYEDSKRNLQKVLI